ncbi:MAG: metalloregulator ArsR/SmtB family transcription factor [Chloroflexota bacterium]|nr:metalloregulator ArsR/SmtB family transcription factor [Chloroflexota bacterium]
MDDVKILQALAEPTRLAIVQQLASDGEVCACDFTDCCGVSQPTVSHHLKVLREAGVVSSERRGTWIYYRLEPKAAARLANLGHLLSAGAQRDPKACDHEARARRQIRPNDRGDPPLTRAGLNRRAGPRLRLSHRARAGAC